MTPTQRAMVVAVGHSLRASKGERGVVLAVHGRSVARAYIDGRGAVPHALVLSPAEARKLAAELLRVAAELDAPSRPNGKASPAEPPRSESP